MGAWTGNYSRTTYDKAKQYLRTLQFQGKPICDCDMVEGQQALYQLVTSLIEGGFGEKFFFEEAFKIVEATPPENNFEVTLGDGYVKGNWAYLHEASDFKSAGATVSEKNLHSISTALAALTLTDRAMHWVPNELVGRYLIPDITSPATSFLITANTATSITVGSGNMTVNAAVGDYYRVDCSTPSGGDRTDTVYLNLYQDEISGVEDPAILQPLGGGLETSRRMKNRTMLHVRQGADDYPSTYTDPDGNVHYIAKVATILRHDGVAAISLVDITDCRVIYAQGAAGSEVRSDPADPTSGYLEDKIEGTDGIDVTVVDHVLQVKPLAIPWQAPQIATDAGARKGRLAGWDASGVPSVIVPGTAGRVLTDNGADTPPTFQAIPGASALPWQSPEVATDAVNRKGRIAGWSGSGVPSVIVPGTAGRYLRDNGADTPPSFAAIPSFEPQTYPTPLFIGSVSGYLNTTVRCPYSEYADIDIPLISIAAYRSKLVLAPNLLQTSRAVAGTAAAPQSREGMCCCLGSCDPSGHAASVSLFIDGIQVYWTPGAWVAQIWGSTYAYIESGNNGFDVYSRGGTFNGHIPAPFSVLYPNFLHFMVYSTDTWLSVPYYTVSTFYGYSTVSIYGGLYVSGDTLRLVLRHAVSSLTFNSHASAMWRYETRTHGIAV